MTSEQHNKFLWIAHCAYAGLHSLMGIFFAVFMVVMLTTIPSSPRDVPPPPAFIVLMTVFMLVFTIGWTIPSMIAAYALLKRKTWAKTASIVAAVFAAAQLPIGTAVAVYTFWFMFGEAGRSLYERPTTLLADSRADLTMTYQGGQKEQEQFLPTAPPDWR